MPADSLICRRGKAGVYEAFVVMDCASRNAKVVASIQTPFQGAPLDTLGTPCLPIRWPRVIVIDQLTKGVVIHQAS